jgi:homospermidine synthase
VLGVHTIHCSEYDNQTMKDIPLDCDKKFYNTWSCRGFLTEGLVPIQVSRGSHED